MSDVVPQRRLGVNGPSVSAIGFGAGGLRTSNPRFKDDLLGENARRFARLGDLARELGISRAQLALAWLLHRGEQVVPIPGMTRPWQVDENLAAATVVLDAAVLSRIDELAPPGLAVGAELD